MFRCREVAERASLMIDGELGFWPRLNMRVHLAICRGCRAFIEQMRVADQLTQLAASKGDPMPSESTRAALAQRKRGIDRRL
jgi:predicted anti-sigma-YlaC factor YlaD